MPGPVRRLRRIKHKPGFLEFVHKFAQRPFSSTFFSIEISLLVFSLKEFLPQSYMEVKGVEKKIFGEHKKNNGLTESEAKVGYVKTARSLSTYGVTFFLVKVVSLNTSQLNQSNTSQLTFVNAFSIILCFDSRPGKKEGQKRTGPAPAGLYERFCPAPRRTNQRDSKSLAVDDDSSLGRVAKNFHPRLWWLFGSVLLGSDDRRRTNLSADCRLHRHYPQKGWKIVTRGT